jgi:hypothetical protein
MGEQLTFDADGIHAYGDVVWLEGDECAVEFATPIAAMEVQHLRLVGGL